MYKVAIPSYKRSETLKKKTLDTLINGGVSSNKIYIFVANKEEQLIYEKAITRETYNKIVIGDKGIANQWKFIKNYFKEKEEIVSLDEIEKRAIENALKVKKGNIMQIAKALGVSRTTLYSKIQKYNILIE